MIKDFLTTDELDQLLPGDGRPVTLTVPEAAALRSHVFATEDRYQSSQQLRESRDENMAALIAYITESGAMDSIRRDTNERLVAEKYRELSATLRRCSVAAAALSDIADEGESIQAAGKAAFGTDLTTVDVLVNDRIATLECEEAIAKELLRRVLTDHGRNAPVHRQLAPGLLGEIEEAVGVC